METFKTTKFSKISNILFLLTAIFCLFFLWCNYYIRNLKISLISSIIVILSFAIIFFPIYIYKSKKNSLSKCERLKKEELKNNLLYNTDFEVFSFLKELLNLDNYNIITYNHIYLKDTNKDLYFLFFDESIILSEIIKIYKTRISNNIDIYCINKSTMPNIENINIKYVDIEEIFKLSKLNSIEFKNKINIKNKSKLSLKDIFCVVLSKSKSKNYFWLGILLLFSSLFTPYSIYYIIMSSLLILLSIFSRFNNIFN